MNTVDILNSKAYTMVDLREIAERMQLGIKGKITKPVLAGVIADAIDILHRDVLATMETAPVNMVKDVDAGTLAQDNRARMVRKINAYMRFNGTDKLSPAQWRRVRKGFNRYNVNIGQLVLTYP
jgi:hypothetical protein